MTWNLRWALVGVLALVTSDAPRVQALTHELALQSEDVAAVSARTGQGLAHVAAWVESWTGLALRRPDGTAHHS